MTSDTAMNGFFIDISKEEWENLPSAQQSWLVYCAIQNLNRRVQCLEDRKYFDKIASFLGGVVGGIATILGTKIKP